MRRREALKALGSPLVPLALPVLTVSRAGPPPSPAPAPAPADPPTSADSRPPRNRFSRMVQEYFVQEVQRAYERHVEAYARLKTRADAEQYVAAVREKIRRCFGPDPDRTPLNPRVTGILERDTYRVEKVIFDSRPGFPVTANLYLPSNAAQPRPGVLGCCGHSAVGKAEPAYQSFAQGLARLGYVCLIYDPISQGERLQYVKEDLSSRIGVGVPEHLYAGNQQFLVGEFLGMWRAWDGMRALDYLLTRPEVDPRHVGVTGNSGGGTLTTWLCGLESRLTMAAPSCFVTTFRCNMENELPSDTEQCPPCALALDLDHIDFLAAMAPKPVAVLTQERDFFDVRGSLDAVSRLRRLYDLLGHPGQAVLYAGQKTHGFSVENRRFMYAWFGKATDIPAGAAERTITLDDPQMGIRLLTDGGEPAITLEDPQTLWCTPQGQVAALKDTRTVFSYTREKSQRLAAGRETAPQTLPRTVASVLKLPADYASDDRRPSRPVPEFRILRSTRENGYPLRYACTYAVVTEPGIMALVYWLTKENWESRPPRSGPDGQGRAILYVAHRSSDMELRNEPLIRDIMQEEPGVPLFTCDVRGIGESMPDTCGSHTFDDPYGCDYFYAIHSLMLDRPYVGQKTWDVLRVLDWLAAHGYDNVHLVAVGWGALPATFAALLSEGVQQVTLKHALTSYAEVAESETYRWPLSTLLPNVLAHFDLPDCYDALRERKQLRQIEPWGAQADGT